MNTQLHTKGSNRASGTLPARIGTDGRTTTVEALVARAAGGDQRAWDALVDRFGRLVWGVARAHRLPECDAADVFQSTWLRLLEHVGGLTHPERLAGWLVTTARREAMRVVRANGRSVPDDELALTLVDPDADAVTHLLVEERAAAMREALATLSQRDQLLLGMLAADPPVPYDEISRTLNMPIGSIGPTRARSMERLRRAAARVGLDAPG